MLCIGGVADGKKITISHYSEHLRVPIPQPFSAHYVPPGTPIPNPSYKIDTYRREHLIVNDKVFAIWRWEELTPEETIGMLIDGYRPQATETGNRTI